MNPQNPALYRFRTMVVPWSPKSKTGVRFPHPVPIYIMEVMMFISKPNLDKEELSEDEDKIMKAVTQRFLKEIGSVSDEIDPENNLYRESLFVGWVLAQPSVVWWRGMEIYPILKERLYNGY